MEDNLDDVELMILALEKNQVTNEVVLAKGGADALDTSSGAAPTRGAPRGVTRTCPPDHDPDLQPQS